MNDLARAAECDWAGSGQLTLVLCFDFQGSLVAPYGEITAKTQAKQQKKRAHLQ